ncbi:unnamed protein product [Cylicocyclus nassatus]|uniref:7TM GPCR serpentine receptor class x (Srx) domain-containing protein n=1 Tax=Cylicocyclus nassatus TaxID=53992 RepID=A0AA36HCG5_CYLNA|nr:unnamed protein product [Cylicocyclus nassatus]
MLVFITCPTLSYWAVFQIETCDFFYDHDLRIWRFGGHTCSVILSIYIDMIYNISLFVLIAFFDLVTLLKLQTIRKNTSSSKFCAAPAAEEMKHKKEVKLFAQAFLISIVNSVMCICFNWISAYIPKGFCLFLCTTYAWELSHVLVGFILIWFNPEIRRHLVGVQHFLNYLTNPTSTIDILHMSNHAPSRN